MTRESELRWASLISGGGTTMNAMAEACISGELAGLVQPVVVISSREKVDGIRKAQARDIPFEILPRKDFPKGLDGIDEYGAALKKVLEKYNPDVVTLNGFLCMVSHEVIDAYPKNIFNQHPGPPEFGGIGMHGMAVHEAVILYGKHTGRSPYYTEVIVQRVSPFQYDQGAVVRHEYVKVLDNDDAQSLQKRALPVEYKVQIALLLDVANGNVKEVDRDPFIESLNDPNYLASIQEAREKYPNG